MKESDIELVIIPKNILADINTIALKEFENWKIFQESEPPICEHIQNIQYYLNKPQTDDITEGCIQVSRELLNNLHTISKFHWDKWLSKVEPMPELCEHLENLRLYSTQIPLK